MNTSRKAIPLPIGCVALGYAGLGLLIQPVAGWALPVCGCVSWICLVLLIVALGSHRPNNPTELSVLCAGPMALMLLSGHLAALELPGARLLWWMGVACHVALLFCFVRRYVLTFSLPQVYASWFLPFVGIAAAGIPAVRLGVSSVAEPIVLFALVCFPVVLAVLILRYCRHFQVEKPLRPLLCICAAPASLCIVGLTKVGGILPDGLLTTLYLAAAGLYLVALGNCFFHLWTDFRFCPAHAAFTFPFVISATASGAIMAQTQLPVASLAAALFPVQRAIAIGLCLFVLTEYLVNLLSPEKNG